MTHEEAEKAAYEETLDHLVIETLRNSKYRIEHMGRRIDYLQPKADAFDALLTITRAGDRYGNGNLMDTDCSPTYQIERTLEKIERHMDAATRQQYESAVLDADGTQQQPWTPPVIDTGDGDDGA